MVIDREQDFNPRALTGRDLASHVPSLHPNISIHAPSRGATVRFSKIAHTQEISIHAPSRGATEIIAV